MAKLERRNTMSASITHRILAAGAAATLALFGTAYAQNRVEILAGDAAGGLSYAINSGIAKVVSQNSPVTLRVRGYSGPEAFLPELDEGKVQLASHFSATAWLAYNQIDSKLKTRNIRLLRAARPATPLGFMVRKDSPIKTVAEMKGHRVAGGYGGHPIMKRLAGGILAAYGLDWSDVQVVPVTAAGDGAQALIDGRVEAAWFAVFAPITREAHSKIGVRFLPIDPTPEHMRIARETIFPGVLPLPMMGNPPWAPKGTPLISYEYYLLGSTKTDAAMVKTVLEALWAKSEEVRKVSPVLGGFVNPAAVTLHPVIPYHPAAIEFYKSKGVWTAEAEKANAAVPQ
jgi:hypothetical protein